jgi:hypothetical protein
MTDHLTKLLLQKKKISPKGHGKETLDFPIKDNVRTYLQLPLLQWGACNVYLLVLSSLKVNIAENTIAVMGL